MSPLHLGLILAGVPAVIFAVMGVALPVEGDTSTAQSTVAAAVIASAVGGTAVLYQIERWSLRRQSALHFAIMLCSVLPALFFSGWFILDGPRDYFTVIGYFLVTGLVIWLVMFLVFAVIVPKRRSAREASTSPREL